MDLLNNFDFLKEDVGSFVVFDLETTGLNRRTDRIVEIGALKYSDGKVVDIFHHLVNPRIPIPSVVSAIHGIKDSDVVGKPYIEQLLPDFLSFIEDSILVAHNAQFDVGFMKKAFGREEIEIPVIDVVDTLRLAKKVWPGRKSYSQVNLANFLDIDVKKAHSADDDCRVCLEILKKAIIIMKEESNE